MLVVVAHRVDDMQTQVDRMAAYIGSYATAASVLVTILAVLITVALGLSAYFAFAVTRNNRLAKSLRSSITELERKREELEASYNARIAELETRIGGFREGLLAEVVARSGLRSGFPPSINNAVAADE